MGTQFPRKLVLGLNLTGSTVAGSNGRPSCARPNAALRRRPVFRIARRENFFRETRPHSLLHGPIYDNSAGHGGEGC